MMQDMSLLEMAAKAAGIELEWSTSSEQSPRNKADGDIWNPLTDDGDALRLAVDLNICIVFDYCLDDAPIVQCGRIHERESWPQDGNFPDPHVTTRRAIVLAAAALAE